MIRYVCSNLVQKLKRVLFCVLVKKTASNFIHDQFKGTIFKKLKYYYTAFPAILIKSYNSLLSVKKILVAVKKKEIFKKIEKSTIKIDTLKWQLRLIDFDHKLNLEAGGGTLTNIKFEFSLIFRPPTPLA